MRKRKKKKKGFKSCKQVYKFVFDDNMFELKTI